MANEMELDQEVEQKEKGKKLSAKEWQTVGQALIAMQKSVMRLAAKEGQPESVAAEYRKVAKELDVLMKKVML